MKTISKYISFLILVILLAGCVSDTIILAKKRPAIPIEQVFVYHTDKADKVEGLTDYEIIGIVTSNEHDLNKDIAGLKRKAAKIGANGIILAGNISDKDIEQGFACMAIYKTMNQIP